MSLTLLAACGLLREARIAALAPDVIAVAGGGNAPALGRRLREAALRHRPAGIVSFGLAGALAPHLRVGDCVVGTAVTGGAEAACDADWVQSLIQALRQPGPDPGRGVLPPPGDARRAGHQAAPSRIRSLTTRQATTVHHGPIHADGTLAATAHAKAALRARAGAIAIDMESHVTARVAADHGLPFAILRVISDTAADALPPAFAVAMRPDGGTNLGAMLRSLAGAPSQLPAVIRAARHGSRALAALGRDGPRALASLPPRT